MEEIEAILTTATLLAKRRGYSIFFVCADHKAKQVQTGVLGKDRDSIIQALVAAGVQEPDIAALIRSAFCNTLAKHAEQIISAKYLDDSLLRDPNTPSRGK